MTKTKIKKQKRQAFGKDIYLLGIDKNNIKYWLRSPSFDNNYYWDFGSVQTYTNNNNPEKAKGIATHSNWNSCIVGEQGHFKEYIHHLNDNPKFKSTTLTKSESWELSELMKSYYSLAEAAEIFNRGGTNTAHTKITYQDKSISQKINKIILPEIFERIHEILIP